LLLVFLPGQAIDHIISNDSQHKPFGQSASICLIELTLV
jgi:hypothetical protein